jgi:hypothetical protein
VCTTDCIAELEVLQKKVHADGASCNEYRRWYDRLHYALGLPATVLAAVAGASAFASHVPSAVVGGSAAVAAALAGMQTFIHADQKSRFNEQQQITYERLEAEIKRTLLALRHESNENLDALGELRRIQERYFDVREHTQSA